MSLILVDLNLAGNDLKDAKSPTALAWQNMVSILKPAAPDGDGPAVLCGRNEDNVDEILLIVRHKTKSEVVNALSPLLPFLATPPRVRIAPKDSIVASALYPDRYSVQQTIIYFPLSKSLDLNILVLNHAYEGWEHRCLAAGMRHGELLEDIEFKGQKCKAWMIFLKWCDGGPLPMDKGGRIGDEEILRNRSVKSSFDFEKMGCLGVEERNWSFVPLDTIAGKEEKGWCIVM